MTSGMARVVLSASLLLLAGAACSTPHAHPGGSASGAATSPACAPEAVVPPGLALPGSFLLFGEYHGTKELPAMFGETACVVARGGTPVTVALEVSRSEQAGVNTYLGSPGDLAAEKLLLGNPHWTRTFQDGRSSRAMVDLLSRIRQLRQAGLGIEVFLFDVEAADAGPTSDAQMASHLSDYLRDHPERTLLVLVGNYHARTAVGAPWDPAKKFTGWYLRQAGHRVASLNFDAPTGTAWACYSSVAAECGVKQLNRQRSDPLLPPGIHLFTAPSPTGYDGTFTVGSLTTSLPSVAAAVH